MAFAVVSLYFISSKSLEVSTNYSLASFLFFGTIVSYNFIKYGVEAKKYLMVSNPYHRLIQLFSFLAFLGAFYLFLGIAKSLWFEIMVLVLLSALYALPFLPQAKNLRSLGGLKIYLVALVWVGCTVLLPVVEGGKSIDLNIVILMLQRLLLVLVLLIPFEIRDLAYDDLALKTLPQRVGVKRTKIFAYLFVVLYFALLFLKSDWKLSEAIAEFILCAALVIAIFLTKEKQSAYFASFWIEAIPIFYAAIWFLTAHYI